MAILMPMNSKDGTKSRLNNDVDDVALPAAKRIKINPTDISNQEKVHIITKPNLPKELKNCETFWTDEIPEETVQSVESEIRLWRDAIFRGEIPDTCETCDRWEILEDNDDGSPSYHECMEFLLNSMLEPQNTKK